MVGPVIYAELMQGPGAERTGGSGAGGSAPSRAQSPPVAAQQPRPEVRAASALPCAPETLRAITPAALESKREALVGLIPADWRAMLDGLPAGAPRPPEGGGAAGAGRAPKMPEITGIGHLSPTPGGRHRPEDAFLGGGGSSHGPDFPPQIGGAATDPPGGGQPPLGAYFAA
jgi:hypothetical protein